MDEIVAFKAAVTPVAQLRKRASQYEKQLEEHAAKQVRLEELNAELSGALDLERKLAARIADIKQSIATINLSTPVFRDVERKHAHVSLLLEHLEQGRGLEENLLETVIKRHFIELTYTNGETRIAFEEVNDILEQFAPSWPIATIARYDMENGYINFQRHMLEATYVLPPDVVVFPLGFSWTACLEKDCTFCNGESHDSLAEHHLFQLCELTEQ